jgi:hypothetical protein
MSADISVTLEEDEAVAITKLLSYAEVTLSEDDPLYAAVIAASETMYAELTEGNVNVSMGEANEVEDLSNIEPDFWSDDNY